MRFTRVLLPLAAALLLCLEASAQAVISARSGVVHFSEGSVFIDDQPLDHKFATFPNIKEGSTLRTEKGRAEVLLTPGVFLRIDENSAIRMRANALSDTRIDFLRGSVIVDSGDALGDNHVVVFYKDTQIRFPKQGVYRLDYEPGTLQAYSGQAEITHDGKISNIDESHLFFFTLDLDTKKLGDGTDDEFYDWARERGNAISAENQLAAQSSGDPGDLDGGDPNALGANPNFGLPGPGIPNTGVPSIGVPSYPDYSYSASSMLMNPFGAYPMFGPYYPFPALPLIVIVRPYGYGTHATGSPGTWSWPHSTIGTGYRSPWTGISHLPVVRPSFTSVRPVSPTVSRPVYVPRPAPAPVGVRAVGHR